MINITRRQVCRPRIRFPSQKLHYPWNRDLHISQPAASPPKPPVYFSNPDSPRIPNSVHRSIPPVYFPAGPSVSKSPSKSRGRKWSLVFAYGTLLASLGGYGWLLSECWKNRQEVPITGRRRYNFLSEEELQAGYQVDDEFLSIIVKSPLLLRPDHEDPNVKAMYKAFEQLIDANKLQGEGLHLLVIDENYRRQAINPFKGQIIVYRALFNESPQTVEQCAGHLAPLIAYEVLHHRDEQISNSTLENSSLPLALLLLPISAVVPWSLLFTAPILASFVKQYISSQETDLKLEKEADMVAIQLMEKAGFRIGEMCVYWSNETELLMHLFNELMRRQIPVDAHDAAKNYAFMEMAQRRYENTTRIIQEKYPGYLENFKKQLASEEEEEESNT